MAHSISSGKKRIGAAYIRVSTNIQMELSPESQLKEILKYADSNGIFIADEAIFMEKEGRSGKKAENRPEFQRMIATAKLIPRPFEVILVWKFSRFARNQDESTFYKGMLRKKLGIDIVSVSEPILDGMYGRLIELIIEWQDEFYSCNLSAEVRRGMTQKALGGGYQSAFPYGYCKSRPGKPPVIMEEQAEVVKAIFHLYTNEELSAAAIARKLNEQGKTTKNGRLFESRTISYILQNPFYTGIIRWNKKADAIEAKGSHKAIIETELFERAKRRLEKEKRSPAVRNTASLHHCLSGLIKCPYCGAGLTYNSSQSACFQCWRYAKGLHSGSASVSEKKAWSALNTSLTEMQLFPVLSILQNPTVSEQEKGNLLQTILLKITYSKENNTFHFYYYM